MKTNIKTKILAFFATGTVLTGCIEETFPQGSTQREDQVSSSELALAGMVNGISAAMMRTGTAGYFSTYGTHVDFGMPAIHIMTDTMLEDIALAGNQNAFQFYMFPYNIGQGDDEWPVSYFWDCYYAWIKLANSLISMIDPKTATPDQLGYLGQAYAYRAMFYLDLARLYEPKPVKGIPNYSVPESILGLTVPIIDENTTEAEAMNNPRVTREVLYDFIFDDLENAEKYLADQGYDFSRPTLGAVYGLYARAYLEQGYWVDGGDAKAFENAVTYADKAIVASKKQILTEAQWENPSSGFNSGSANNSWIWGLTVSSEQIGNILNFNAHMSCESLWGYAPMSQPAINKMLFDQIPDADFRKRSWLDPEWNGLMVKNPGDKEIDYKFAGGEADYKVFIEGNVNNGGNVYPAAPYEAIKFRPVMGEMNDDRVGAPADHMLMRVEEMHFIKMEATAHKDLGKAIALLNDFMKHRVTDGSYDCTEKAADLKAFTNEMLLQKRVEFWGEGILLYDYKRLDRGITRYYPGSNHPAIWQFNTTGRSPQWNLTISSVGELQSNSGITQATNNPDPSGTLVVPE